MGWVRLDDAIGGHPKIARISNDALALWVMGLAYSNRHLTDGFIPEAVGYGQLRHCPGGTASFVEELENAQLWERVLDGWVIHDFLHYQRSRVEILGERETVRDRVKRHRDAVGNEERNVVTSPVPLGFLEVEGVGGSGGEGFEAFYAAFPRHVGRRAAERAWRSALKRTDAATIIAGAERLRADPNLPEKRFIPYPASWLNRDGWLDEDVPSPNGRPMNAKTPSYYLPYCRDCETNHAEGEHTS